MCGTGQSIATTMGAVGGVARERVRRRAMALCLWLAAASAPALASAGAPPCDVNGVTVVAARAEDAADACRGARAAVAFFEAQQLSTDLTVGIHVQNDLPPPVSRSAAGCYLEREKKILLRPYATFRKNGTWFKVPIDRRMYRSLAAHEVAHALAACNFSITNPSVQAKEYIAYVVMFSTMDAALRARILKAYPEPGFRNADRLTALLFMFDPMRFGVQAYRHHLDTNGLAFLQEVLAGRALTD